VNKQEFIARQTAMAQGSNKRSILWLIVFFGALLGGIPLSIYAEHHEELTWLGPAMGILGNNYIGAEHLLLGMLALGQCGGLQVLQKLGLDLEQVRTKMKSRTAPGRIRGVSEDFPYTPRSRRILKLAAEEATNLKPNNNTVGTEHLLLGLLSEADSLAARVLQELGIDVSLARQNIVHDSVDD
jgi:ATP-dependent Clp protease ATP-binding subunit ClpA